jgi:phenylalanyl-tRNA synthetase alpha chain
MGRSAPFFLSEGGEMLEEQIRRVLQEFETDSKGAASPQELRNKYFGRKNGIVTLLMKELQQVPAAEKPAAGKQINELKLELEAGLSRLEADAAMQSLSARLQSERVDVTLPGNRRPAGHFHPLTQVRNEVEEIFSFMGYSIEDGPEIETTFYNFEALNTPEHHPARDPQDTFYISDTLVLRTHTSPVQIRTMQKQRPPLRIICPGKVYRRDNPDATHSPAFQQIEGLAVDEGLTFRDFKGTLEYFLKSFFSQKTRVRFRPSYFAFTEPSAEVDISCIFCSGEGCRVCKGSGWVEVLGAGMVDPAVFQHVNYDPEKYTGFAFGLGIERFAMLKYSVNNIQHFYESDLRFLEQF